MATHDPLPELAALDAGGEGVRIPPGDTAPLTPRVRALLDTALGRVADFKKKMHPATPFSRAEFDAINREIWDLRVAVLGEERAHQRSTDAGSHSPVELY